MYPVKKYFLPAALLAALLLTTCCACSNAGAGTANTGSQTWEKSDAYTLQLPQGFAAQEGENGVVNLSLKGQGVGGVQTLSYADAQSLLTMDFTKEENKATVDALAQQIAPGQQMAAMLNHTEGAPYLLLTLAPDTSAAGGQEETAHYLFPQGDKVYDLYFQVSEIPAEQQLLLVDSFMPKA